MLQAATRSAGPAALVPPLGLDAAPIKRGFTAFTAFGLEMRVKVKTANPNAGPKDIEKKVGQLWASLSEEEKHRYQLVAQAMKGRAVSGPGSPATAAAAPEAQATGAAAHAGPVPELNLDVGSPARQKTSGSAGGGAGPPEPLSTGARTGAAALVELAAVRSGLGLGPALNLPAQETPTHGPAADPDAPSPPKSQSGAAKVKPGFSPATAMATEEGKAEEGNPLVLDEQARGAGLEPAAGPGPRPAQVNRELRQRGRAGTTATVAKTSGAKRGRPKGSTTGGGRGSAAKKSKGATAAQLAEAAALRDGGDEGSLLAGLDEMMDEALVPLVETPLGLGSGGPGTNLSAPRGAAGVPMMKVHIMESGGGGNGNGNGNGSRSRSPLLIDAGNVDLPSRPSSQLGGENGGSGGGAGVLQGLQLRGGAGGPIMR